jgi:hypothetical protein
VTAISYRSQGVRVIVSGRNVTTVDILAGDTVQPLKDGAPYRVACNDYIGEICKHYAKCFAGLEYQETYRLREALESALMRWARGKPSSWRLRFRISVKSDGCSRIKRFVGRGSLITSFITQYLRLFAFSSVGRFLGHLSKTGIFRQAPQGGILPTTPFPNNDSTSPRCRLFGQVTRTHLGVISSVPHLLSRISICCFASRAHC